MGPDRTIRWKPLTGSGLEHLHVRRHERAIQARASLITPDFGCFYDITLRPDWTFVSASIRRSDGAGLTLSVDGVGGWTQDGRPRPDLAGCIDIDLSGSPFTNTLPIRRARWEIGVPQAFTMAWISLDDMTVRPDGQIYTRLAPDRFRYQAADGGFEAEIAVDEHGFVLDYPLLFVAE